MLLFQVLLMSRIGIFQWKPKAESLDLCRLLASIGNGIVQRAQRFKD